MTKPRCSDCTCCTAEKVFGLCLDCGDHAFPNCWWHGCPDFDDETHLHGMVKSVSYAVTSGNDPRPPTPNEAPMNENERRLKDAERRLEASRDRGDMTAIAIQEGRIAAIQALIDADELTVGREYATRFEVTRPVVSEARKARLRLARG